VAVLGMVTLSGAVLLAASSPASTGSRGGLYGSATKGPLTPVCTVAVPCYGPARNTRVAFVNARGVKRWVTTDAYGNYWVTLRPGRYAVTSQVGMGVVDPGAVRVKRGRPARIDLALDTGLR
jgi:hypothetical protein